MQMSSLSLDTLAQWDQLQTQTFFICVSVYVEGEEKSRDKKHNKHKEVVAGKYFWHLIWARIVDLERRWYTVPFKGKAAFWMSHFHETWFARDLSDDSTTVFFE